MAKGPCPLCHSSDACETYPDGHSFCYSCYKPSRQNISEFSLEKFSRSNTIKQLTKPTKGLMDRGISLAAAQRFMIDVDETGHHFYPYFDKDGRHAGNKVRTIASKEFRCEGDIPAWTLFGQHLFHAGQSAITVVEGECDAAAVWDCFGGRDYPVVSVTNGAAGSARDCAKNFEYLNSFEKIVICFDKDEAKVNPTTGEIRYPGQEAALSVAALFPLGKARILTLQKGKDPNEYLSKGLAEEFVREWWKAPIYTPTGLKLGSEMWEEISNPVKHEAIPYPYEGLNKATYGIRLSELVLITADTGVGKTSILKEFEHHVLKMDIRAGVGLLHIEEPNVDTALGLMSISADKPLHLPDVRETVSKEELNRYYTDVIDTDRLVLWDHFGSNSIDEVLSKIRHMVALGCKYIIIDHLTILVSDQSGDERKQLDEISTKLKTLCMERKLAIICVIHTNRQGKVRSSAGPEQVANIVFKLGREIEAVDDFRRNVLRVTCTKNRFCGITGPVLLAEYSPETGRLLELSKERAALYLSGGTKVEDWT